MLGNNIVGELISFIHRVLEVYLITNCKMLLNVLKTTFNLFLFIAFSQGQCVKLHLHPFVTVQQDTYQLQHCSLIVLLKLQSISRNTGPQARLKRCTRNIGKITPVTELYTANGFKKNNNKQRVYSKT